MPSALGRAPPLGGSLIHQQSYQRTLRSSPHLPDNRLFLASESGVRPLAVDPYSQRESDRAWLAEKGLDPILPILNLAKVPMREVRLQKLLRTDSLLSALDTGLDDGD